MTTERTTNRAERNTHPVTFDTDGVPVSDAFGDTFFSRSGGEAEVRHVFLQGNGLPARWAEDWNGEPGFQIAELGFGTGLSFLTTLECWVETRRPGQHLTFTSFEAYPVSRDVLARSLCACERSFQVRDALVDAWSPLRSGVWGLEFDQTCRLEVVFGDARETVADWPGQADAWFLDGFAPAKNPEMWEADLMKAVAEKTRSGGTCATYSAAGWVRRNLEAAGFEMAKCAGFGRKREMLAGRLAAG